MKYDFLKGEVLLFDKPYGWTSFDLVKKIRNLVSKYLGVKKIKVGHAGTLDPMATGLMILCTGKATKKLEEFQGLDKSYEAGLEFGKTTPSFDAETEADRIYPWQHITREKLEEILKKYTGTIEQLPPAYSAKRVKGRRAYQLAREGKDVVLKPQKVTIHEIDILEFDLPHCKLRIDCSKGTYIRSLARDIGFALGSGAYLTSLRRITIGPYHVDNAMSVSDFEKNLGGM